VLGFERGLLVRWALNGGALTLVLQSPITCKPLCEKMNNVSDRYVYLLRVSPFPVFANLKLRSYSLFMPPKP